MLPWTFIPCVQTALIIGNILHNNIFISQVAFMAIINHVVKEVCTEEMVKKSFSATGVNQYNQNKIDLSAIPSSSAGSEALVLSPLKATC